MRSRILTTLLLAFLIVSFMGVNDCLAQTDPMPVRTLIPELDGTYNAGSEERNFNDGFFSGDTFISKINYGKTITYTGDLTITVVLDYYPELETGLTLSFRATTPNTTGAFDLVYDGTTDAVKMLNNQAPAADYIESGSMVEVKFDGTNWQLISPDANP